MSKVGNYIVGASVVAVMAGMPEVATAQNVAELENFEANKVELIDDTKDVLKNDNAIAWEEVYKNEKDLKEKKEGKETREELKDELKKDSWQGYQTINELGKAPRIKNLEYQNDSISPKRALENKENGKGRTDAYYTPSYNTITDNIYEGEKEQTKEETLLVLAHEVEHMHQNAKVNMNADMSLGQHYKLHCYKEISANIAGVLQLRQMYKEASNDDERKNIINVGKEKGFSFYFKAIERGEIDPNSKEKDDFDKEMSMIANKTKNLWLCDSYDFYDDEHAKKVFNEICDGTAGILPNDENYNEAKRLLLNIGGIDFSKYIENDIECNNVSINVVDEKVQKGESIDKEFLNIKGNDKYYSWSSGLEFEEVKGLKGFSLEQQYELGIQKAFADKIVDKNLVDLVGKGEDISQEVNKKLEKVLKDNEVFLKSSVFVYELSQKEGVMGKASDKEYQKKLREIWSFENSDGKKVCLLDCMGGKGVDVSKDVGESSLLKEKDERSWFKKAKDLLKSKFNKNKKDEGGGESIISEKYRVAVKRDEPLEKPNYGKHSSATRSDVLTTNDVIDTRTDFLKKEREERIKNKLNNELGQNKKLEQNLEISKDVKTNTINLEQKMFGNSR